MVLLVLHVLYPNTHAYKLARYLPLSVPPSQLLRSFPSSVHVHFCDSLHYVYAKSAAQEMAQVLSIKERLVTNLTNIVQRAQTSRGEAEAPATSSLVLSCNSAVKEDR